MDMGLIIKTEEKDGLPFKDKPAVDGTNFGYLPKTWLLPPKVRWVPCWLQVSVNVSTLRPIRSIHV